MSYDTVIKNGLIVQPGLGRFVGSIAIKNGKVVALSESPDLSGEKVIDAAGKVILPGVIDSHTHWGYTSPFNAQCEADSRAACLGGVTTALVYQRFNEGVSDALFEQRITEAQAVSHVDFCLHPIIRQKTDVEWLEHGIARWGITNYKFFMAYKGGFGSDTARNELDDGLMYDAFGAIAKYRPILASVHAENFEISEYFLAKEKALGHDGLRAWHASSPGMAESENAMRASYFAELQKCPILIVHLGSKEAIDIMRRVKSHYALAYAETCPHYLCANVDDSTAGNLAKISPPVRTRQEMEMCWDALKDGTFDIVGSDNTSTRLENKGGTIWDALRGIPGSGTILPLLISEGVHKRGLSLERLVEVTSAKTAQLFGLEGKKGTLRPGADADLVVVDLELEKTITPELLQGWSDYNIYTGMKVKGWPVLTMVRGRVMQRDGEIVEGASGYGRYNQCTPQLISEPVVA